MDSAGLVSPDVASLLSTVSAWTVVPRTVAIDASPSRAMKRLASRDLGSPLSGKVLQEAADELLGGVAGSLPDGDLRQDEPIAVAVTLASLAGFEYLIGDVEKRTAVRGVTHLDWAEFTFRADSSAEEWGRAAQAALASGANAVGFPPKLLRRTPDDQKRAKENGILNPPGPDGAWYTDGGTINNEPFGRILDLVSDGEHVVRTKLGVKRDITERVIHCVLRGLE